MLGVMVTKSVVLVGMITWTTLLIPLLLTLPLLLPSDSTLLSIKDLLMNLWVSLISKLKLLMPINLAKTLVSKLTIVLPP
jgi:hypothetical protein